jgi:peptide/nickel transport system permease protein
MLKYLLRRFVNYLILVFIATSMAYLLAAMTFHPENNYNQRNPPVPKAVIEKSLNDINANPQTPLLKRYGHWLNGIAHGNFGKEFPRPDSVSSEMGRRMFVSLRLLLLGTIIGTVSGVLIGVFGAVRQRKFFDHVSTVWAYLVLASPVVVLILLVQTVGAYVNKQVGDPSFLPLTGEYDSTRHGVDFWVNRGVRLILPTLSLSLGTAAFFSRSQRSTMLDVLGSDFLRTARAKGLTRGQALMKHGVRTALIPLVTFFAFSFGLILVGATFTEKLFGWHGMGEYLVDSITNRDINSTAAVACFTAVLILFSGMLSDVLYAALDPRVRAG